MDARRIRPLFLPPHPRRNQYIPLGQVSARGAKTTTGESILPSKIEPASLGFDFEKRTTLQVFLSKTKGKLSFS